MKRASGLRKTGPEPSLMGSLGRKDFLCLFGKNYAQTLGEQDQSRSSIENTTAIGRQFREALFSEVTSLT
jgi:hypothetical protein